MSFRKLIAAGATALALAFAASPADAGAVSLQAVGSYASPVYVTSDPSNPDRLFIVERAGKIQLTTPSGTTQFLDMTNLVESGFQERGLLSMAFAPDYATSGLFYVYYTSKGDGAIHVAELKSSGDTADPRTIRNVITIPHASAPNHNGGQLQFGPDGYLYFGTGDGGAANDPPNNGQTLSALLGKLIRIDPRQSGSDAYTVPADNPFVGQAGAAPEIWSYGLRNPYRFSFDRETGALVIGDVGQDNYEEIDYATQPSGGRGVNYGWRCREGFHANPTLAPANACSPSDAVDPVLEYPHSTGGCSITGGYVVRDPGLTELAGRYVYSDYCAGQLRSTVLAATGATDDRSEGVALGSPSSFGQDVCGRVYVTSLTGAVSRLVDSTPTDCSAFGGTPPPDPAAACASNLDGSDRKDALDGGPGGQRIDGKGGDDKLKGGSGDDCLDGGAGKDSLTGGSGADRLNGGPGADRIHAADGERDIVRCSAGDDRATVDRMDRVRACERVHVPKLQG